MLRIKSIRAGKSHSKIDRIVAMLNNAEMVTAVEVNVNTMGNVMAEVINLSVICLNCGEKSVRRWNLEIVRGLRN